MDKERKKHLKKLGKAEVKRLSDELHQSLKEANPLDPGDPGWAENYRVGSKREKWLRSKLPVLHEPKLSKLFSVRPYANLGWLPHIGAYVQCDICGSAIPCARNSRYFDYVACKCKNVVWWHFLKWRNTTIKTPSNLTAVKLIGRG